MDVIGCGGRMRTRPTRTAITVDAMRSASLTTVADSTDEGTGLLEMDYSAIAFGGDRVDHLPVTAYEMQFRNRARRGEAASVEDRRVRHGEHHVPFPRREDDAV